MILLDAASLLSSGATKAVCIGLLIGNAIALYFIATCYLIPDKSKMRDVLGTDRRETFARRTSPMRSSGKRTASSRGPSAAVIA